MPTFLDYFNVQLPPHVQGRSLKKMLEDNVGRQDGIFGYFGMAMNVTDGRYVYMRNPVNEDAGPLYSYTAMPTGGLNRWYPREVYDRVETGRYFGHTYNLPLYRIPTEGKVPRNHPEEASYAGRNQIFDVANDPSQQHPLSDPKLETHFTDRITWHLNACEAMPEQFTRLGIDPPGVSREI